MKKFPIDSGLPSGKFLCQVYFIIVIKDNSYIALIDLTLLITNYDGRTEVKKLDSYLTRRQPVDEISISELKQLLTFMSENPGIVSIRYRLVGEMWQQNFLRVVRLTDNEIHLQDDQTTTRKICVRDLSMIMQFELDGSWQTFQPNFHYGVVAG